MYENIKELLNNSKYNDAKNLIVEELKNNDNPDLWYLLFLAENNNYLDFNFSKIKNTRAFVEATKYDKDEYSFEYDLFKNLSKYENLGNIFRLIQMDKMNEAILLLENTKCPDDIDDKTIKYMENVIIFNEECNLKYLLFLEFLLNGTNNIKISNLIERIKSKDDSDFQNSIGDKYYNGDGVEQDFNKAIYYYEKSAKQGNPKAQYNLGNCYYYGEGVEKNFEKSVHYYMLASKQGDVYAQYNLGNCYENGYGVAKDISKASYWYEKAAKKNNIWIKK